MTPITDTIPTEAPPSADWLGYEPPSRAPDEAFDGRGGSRPHWGSFFQLLGHLGLDELTRRWDEARQLIRENGVTYNVYGDPRGMDRPWQLDPIPLLISPAECQVLEAGLIQRGRLLETILADLYGPQTLLHDGPAAARAGLRQSRLPAPLPRHPPARAIASCISTPPTWAVRPTAAFRVLGDRTQSPSGAGYTLENRIVLSRMLPDAFRDCQVQRLALFFRTLRDTLRSIAPHNRDNPRIVLLTPGPFNETYFEHAYLARYLGYTLVEGGDLTVRDNQVFLKVLGGLQPVDVIFRRLDDDFCDPLELRPIRFWACRAGAGGAGRATSPWPTPWAAACWRRRPCCAFLPSLCRHFLGEDLLLPSVPTWWCGEPQACDYVLGQPVATWSSSRPSPRCGASRSSTSQLSQEQAARPWPSRSAPGRGTSSARNGCRCRRRRCWPATRLRAAADGHAHLTWRPGTIPSRVMPGGLTRVSGSAETMVVSMQKGGGSKDTWVLADGPVSTFSLLPARNQPVELSRGGSDLPSRVADNLFWLGRYAERAEGTDPAAARHPGAADRKIGPGRRAGAADPAAGRHRAERLPSRLRRRRGRGAAGGPGSGAAGAHPRPAPLRQPGLDPERAGRAWPARSAIASPATCGACCGDLGNICRLSPAGRAGRRGRVRRPARTATAAAPSVASSTCSTGRS